MELHESADKQLLYNNSNLRLSNKFYLAWYVKMLNGLLLALKADLKYLVI